MITTGRIGGFIHLGTNSARLLIARLFPDRTYQVITRRKELVRLGEGKFTNGYLQPDAMDRAVLVCRRFVKIASAASAQDIFAVATSATRDARNQTQFLHRLESENLPELHVISGKEEARLIYLGVIRLTMLFCLVREGLYHQSLRKSLCVSILTNGEVESLQNKCYE